MAITTQPQPTFVCDTEAELDNTWPDGSTAYCKDTDNRWHLEDGVFKHLNAQKMRFVQNGHKTVANTTTETSLVGAGDGTLAFTPAFWYADRVIRGKIRGGMSTTGTPTLNLKLKFGTTLLVQTGAWALSGTINNDYWEADFEITCRTKGVAGTIMVVSEFNYDNADQTGKKKGMIPASISTVTLDMTTNQTLDLTATWGTASSLNTITSASYIVETLN